MARRRPNKNKKSKNTPLTEKRDVDDSAAAKGKAKVVSKDVVAPQKPVLIFPFRTKRAKLEEIAVETNCQALGPCSSSLNLEDYWDGLKRPRIITTPSVFASAQC